MNDQIVSLQKHPAGRTLTSDWFVKFFVMIVYCCDIGQNDTIGKIELFSSSDLSSRDPDCKNNIQLFFQQFEKLLFLGVGKIHEPFFFKIMEVSGILTNK